MKYTYSSKNPFDEKINYSYSKTSGLEFIKSWKKHRECCIDIINKSKCDYENLIDNSKTNIEFQKWLKSSNILLSEIGKLHLLIKRFEVTKRIYDRYDEDYRRINSNSNYSNLNLYINFGLILLKLYKKHKHLQYLNSLLKVNDIICSVILYSKIENIDKKSLLNLFFEEIDIINKLCKFNKVI